jgi:hypothetical protein
MRYSLVFLRKLQWQFLVDYYDQAIFKAKNGLEELGGKVASNDKKTARAILAKL